MTGFTKRSSMPAEALSLEGDAESVPHVPEDALRVLFVVDSFLPGVGGAEIQAVNLGKALTARGVRVEYVAPRLYREWPKKHLVEGMPVVKIDYPRIRLFGSMILILKFAFYLLRHAGRYDSIHIHVTDKLASMAGILRPLIKTPMIAKISGYYEFEEGVLKNDGRKSPVQLFNRVGLHNIDFFQTISQQTRDKLLEAGFKETQIKYIPNGVTVDTEQTPRTLAASQTFVVGYCGRLRDIKGVDVLIRAMSVLVNDRGHDNIKLRIAGEGRTRPKLDELIKTLGIENNIEFLGSIQETQQFMETLDLYVQPSHAEGLPNSVIEAMNAGCPVVATDIGGNRDLVTPGNNGFLVPAGDHEALAGAMEDCVKLGSSLNQMGEASRQFISDGFSFKHVTDRLIELYSS